MTGGVKIDGKQNLRMQNQRLKLITIDSLSSSMCTILLPPIKSSHVFNRLLSATEIAGADADTYPGASCRLVKGFCGPDGVKECVQTDLRPHRASPAG
ncbi:hypothetical protein C0Q70_18792 [Pomacea canaliculata]|uniref:Uncharacterized protein n=1 Tax=Pomacea canaliculata TaxID=400727 RepID=A0A2T7NHI5_POMCA|nr:hypothetical protein C0Q70_18792 [Pomacea canaliculata]